jgi:hypothetical protein
VARHEASKVHVDTHVPVHPSTRFIAWVERVHTTTRTPSGHTRTLTEPGAKHARLVLPVPLWLPRLVWDTQVLWRRVWPS